LLTALLLLPELHAGTTVKGAIDDLDIHCDGDLDIHHHGQPQRPRAAVPVVRAQRQGPQGHPRRRPLPRVPRDEAFVRKWQLACQGDVAHVVVMPNVGVDKITSFVEDLAAKRGIWYQYGGLVGMRVAKDTGQENCLCGLHDKGANFPPDEPSRCSCRRI
jgi:hypothetical protein